MTITVEFYGIPRARAGIERLEIQLGGDSVTLSTILDEVAKLAPRFAETCMNERRLNSHCIASIDGERFVDNDDALIEDDRTVFILSADAGG